MAQAVLTPTATSFIMGGSCRGCGGAGWSGRKGGGWVYTVGLLENFGHPELIVTDIDYEVGGALLNELGERVRSGMDLRTMSADSLGLAHVRHVHSDHFHNDLVNTYFDLQHQTPDRGDYLQVVPANAFCDGCRDHITDLSDPLQFPEGRKLNRAQRRTAQRQAADRRHRP